ncbi:MAG: SymE family type I addiction module toxin [Candidatus Thiodiazotropha sp.]|jgi:hypothetical protein
MAKNHCKGKARPVKTPHNRTLTVDKFYHYYIPSKDAPPGTSNRSIAVPCIYFKGRWLEQAGFKIGSMVKIRVRPGRLILTNK